MHRVCSSGSAGVTRQREPRARTRFAASLASPKLQGDAFLHTTRVMLHASAHTRTAVHIHSLEKRPPRALCAHRELRRELPLRAPSPVPPALSTLLDRRATLRNLRERVQWGILERDAWSAAPAPWHVRRTRKPGNTTAEASPRSKDLPSRGNVNLEPGRLVSRTLARGSAQPGLSITQPALVRHAVHDRQSHSFTFGRVL